MSLYYILISFISNMRMMFYQNFKIFSHLTIINHFIFPYYFFPSLIHTNTYTPTISFFHNLSSFQFFSYRLWVFLLISFFFNKSIFWLFMLEVSFYKKLPSMCETSLFSRRSQCLKLCRSSAHYSSQRIQKYIALKNLHKTFYYFRLFTFFFG